MKRVALYVLAVLAAAGWGVAAWHANRADRILESEAVRVLRARGFRDLQVSRRAPRELREPDLPAGSYQIATVEINVPPLEATPPVVEVRVCDGEAVTKPNWTLRPGDLGLADGQVSIVGTGHNALARWSGRILAQTPAGLVERDVADEPSVDLAGWVATSAVRWPTWEVRAGIDTDLSPVLGVTHYRGQHIGWWGEGSRGRAAGGVAIRW